MKNALLLTSTCSLLSSCVLPDTPLWNDRSSAKAIRMPMEATTKVVVLSSLTSAVRNPFSSTQKGISMLRNRAEIASKLDTLPALQHQIPKKKLTIEQKLNELKMPAPIGGNIDYLIDGKAFFSALRHSVLNAKQSIDTRVFIFDNDDIAVSYANLLKQKSKTLRTRVMMDELGSLSSWWTVPETKLPKGFKPPSSMPHYLRQGSKIQVRKSRNPWLVTDHAKLILIDKSEAFLGGMNIGREYRYEWHDMMFRLKGPVVKALQNDFNKAWRLQGGLGDWGYPFLRKSPYRKTILKNEIPIRILKTGPSTKQIETAIIAAINLAQRRVYIQNSYFTSKPLALALANAAKRGIDVRMIYPETNDSTLLHIGNQDFANTLIEAKAKVYLFPKFTHVKALVVDDWSCIGSANYDALSMRINSEINVAFTHKKATQKLVNELFNKDFKQSKRLRKLKTNVQKQLLQPVIEQL